MGPPECGRQASSSTAGGTTLEFRILGPFDVVDGERVLDLGSPKQRALLALLVIHAGRTLTTDRILDELWGDDAQGKENALWVYISRLRTILEPDRPARGENTVLVTRDHGYALTVDPDTIDARRFEAQVAAGRRELHGDPEAAAATLAAALSQWRGTALQDFTYDEFARAERDRLDQLRLDATADRIDADLRCGRARDVVGELDTLHREHPLRERFVEQLMLALYRSGRHADALRAFQGFRQHLREEAGLDPSPRLCRLEERVLIHDDGLQAPAHVRAATPIAAANPFRGLRAFGQDDVVVFHGRERLVADVLRRITGGAPLVALIGPSGSGKSSVVGAGVVPAVRKLAGQDAPSWIVAHMVPGAHPFAELEVALRRAALDAPADLGELFADPATGMLRAVLGVLPDDHARLLLVIDQFEELFSLVDDGAVRDGFLDQLVTLIDDPRRRVVVVLTLRADFYPRPLEHADFGSRLGDGVINVVPLRPDELERAAKQPAAQVGVHLEPALLASLLADVIGRPGTLPLFQFALTELFERRTDDVLALASYEAMGGVAGAVTTRADEVFAQLSNAERAAATQLFLRLVAISDDGAWTRRRTRVSEITALRVDVVALERVLDLYSEHRLLTLDRDDTSGAPTVEVAHEALLTQWPRLRDWIGLARDDIGRHAALVAAMAEWEGADRDPGYLLSGTRLRDYEQWAATATMQLTDDERAYLDTSVRLRDDARAREAERRRSEQQLAASARRRLWAVAAMIAAFVIAGGALVLRVVRADPPRVVAMTSRLSDEQRELVAAGLDRAALELGVTVEQVGRRSGDVAQDYRALADAGADLVFIDPDATGPDVEAAIAAHPETVFAAIGAADPPDGAYAITFADEHAGYLAGVAAAATTWTRVVGFVGDRQDLYQERLRAGFEAGARRVDGDVTILATYVGQAGYSNSVILNRANASADLLYERGADVVFAATGDASTGVFESALDRTLATGRDVFAIGADSDWQSTAPGHLRDHVRASALRRWDAAVFDTVQTLVDGDRPHGVTELTAADGALTLAADGTQRVQAAVDDAIDDIRAGRVVVPSVPTGASTAPPDAEIVDLGTVTWDGRRCTADDIPVDIPSGATLRLALDNRSDGPGALTVTHDLQGTQLTAIAPAGARTVGYAAARTGTLDVTCRSVEGRHLADAPEQPAAAVDVRSP